MMRLSAVGLCFFCLVLSACGWHLRGLNRSGHPEALALVVENRFEPLVLTAQNILRQNDIALDPSAEISLHLGRERLDRRTVAVTSIGSASQYELILSVPFNYRKKGQTPGPDRVLRTTRVFDFDPTNTVAKNEEENTLLEEMRRELALRLLDNIPSNYAENKP